MVCLICKQKFTRVQRKAHTCVKCEKRTCIGCIKKDFKLKFISGCSFCSDHFHPEIYTIPPPAILDKIYTFIKRKENLEPPGWVKNFRQIAVEKVSMGKTRVKLLKEYLQKFPDDKKILFILNNEMSLIELFQAIEANSELLQCYSCPGKTTVNSFNLQYLCKLKILSVFEDNTYPYTLPRAIMQVLLNIPPRTCLSCNKEHTETLLSRSKRVLERRCHLCGFLIVFYKRHNDIDTICCPKCSVMVSRWGGKVLQDLSQTYKTFFEFSSALVHGDTRDY